MFLGITILSKGNHRIKLYFGIGQYLVDRTNVEQTVFGESL